MQTENTGSIRPGRMPFAPVAKMLEQLWDDALFVASETHG